MAKPEPKIGRTPLGIRAVKIIPGMVVLERMPTLEDWKKATGPDGYQTLTNMLNNLRIDIDG